MKSHLPNPEHSFAAHPERIRQVRNDFFEIGSGERCATKFGDRETKFVIVEGKKALGFDIVEQHDGVLGNRVIPQDDALNGVWKVRSSQRRSSDKIEPRKGFLFKVLVVLARNTGIFDELDKLCKRLLMLKPLFRTRCVARRFVLVDPPEFGYNVRVYIEFAVAARWRQRRRGEDLAKFVS